MRELDVPDMERLADASDMASKHEQANNERAIDAVRSKIEKAPDDFDGTHCTECGHEIPEDRRKTGAFRDIYCQEKHELNEKRYRREK